MASLDTFLIAFICVLEIARWMYDLWWFNQEAKALKEQTELLEEIAVALSIQEQ